ncbi:MAG: GntR family transcriptional regulator [Acidobacteriaceae bacterium]|jgi:DNA-binding GntR family transcriptional regulator
MASKGHSLRRDSMAERVKQDILRRIMNGELPPGTRLVELQIAKELNTSQGPVREALCELEGLELVVTEPYKGSRVREVTPQDIREAYMVRAMLENLAGQLAAPHFEGSVAALKKAASTILSAAKKKDVRAYARHDMNFHRLIVEGAANRILLRTWNSLAFEVRLQMWLMRSNIDLMAVQEAHWKIIDALEQGNGKRAGELLQKHIFNLPADT